MFSSIGNTRNLNETN